MSVAEQLSKTAQNLVNARQAVLYKGGNVGASVAFDNLASEIESIPSGDANYVLVDDTDTAYRKSILAGASPIAKLKSIGGMTYKRFKEDGNLLPYPYISANDMQGTFTVSQDSFADDWNMEITATLVDSTNSFTLPAGTYIFNFNASIITDINDMSPAGWVTINDVTKDVYVGADENATFTFDTDTLVTNISVWYEWQMNSMDDLPATGSISPLLVNGSDYNVFFKPRVFDLVDTKVTEVVSYGANLTTAQEAYKGAGRYLETVVDGRNCIRFSSGSSMKNAPITFESNTQYTVSFYAKSENYLGATNSNVAFTFYYDDGTNTVIRVEPDATTWAFYTLTSSSGKTVTHIGIVAAEYKAYVYLDIDTFMLNEGTTAAPYKPYREPITYTIPEALQGNGKGVKGYSTTYADTVDLERGKFVEKCETITLNGSESWTAYTLGGLPSGMYCYYNATIKANGKIGIFTSICSHFDNIESAWDVARRTGVYSDHHTLPRLYFVTDRATVDEWKAYLTEQYSSGNPVTLTYILATPIETDLPETFSNLIEVEGGGSLEFVNEHSNSVPSHISYLRRIV